MAFRPVVSFLGVFQLDHHAKDAKRATFLSARKVSGGRSMRGLDPPCQPPNVQGRLFIINLKVSHLRLGQLSGLGGNVHSLQHGLLTISNS